VELKVYINLLYLLASVCFIIGLKCLSSVRTAKTGNLIGAGGMALAVLGAMIDPQIAKYTWILLAILVGTGAGVLMAMMVRMTAMPQMVGLLNGFGGGASALVASAELLQGVNRGTSWGVATACGIFIGWVTFTGSLVAFGKLQGLVTGKPVTLPGFKAINGLMAAAMLGLSVFVVRDPTTMWAFWALSGVSVLMGILLVIPIGGADMPVVISLLNSYSGMAACATGFSLGNNGLIITGALVGASGIILTNIMCKAMNRSLMNVMFAAVGAEEGAAAGKKEGDAYATVRSGGPDEAAMLFDGAQKVVIVPGYGMAVSQAQHVVAELTALLQKKGMEVRFAIHPVAGRMPGHMNILLAEANISYDLLMDMDAVNPLFPEADVALVVGANDITNPAARTRKDSPLYGMPILEVDRARSVIFLKRGLGAGFAGVENELFVNPKTMMLFGDAKDSLTKLAGVLKSN
jgi:NAD(P) transhydrogenase subunit beta